MDFISNQAMISAWRVIKWAKILKTHSEMPRAITFFVYLPPLLFPVCLVFQVVCVSDTGRSLWSQLQVWLVFVFGHVLVSAGRTAVFWLDGRSSFSKAGDNGDVCLGFPFSAKLSPKPT